jgi:hypothetical protein
MKKTMLLLVLLSGCLVLSAQTDKAKIIALLTHGHQRNWVLGNVTYTLGDRCSGSGSLFTFSKDGTLEQRQCVNGSLVLKTTEWKLTPVNNSDREWQLTLSEPLVLNDHDTMRIVRIDFSDGNKEQSRQPMTWRYMPTCHLCPVVIMRFKSAD